MPPLLDSVHDTELLMEIFRRLPLSDLANLMCVCRSWRNLISSPAFHRKLLPSRCHRIGEDGIIVQTSNVVRPLTNPSAGKTSIVPTTYSSFEYLPYPYPPQNRHQQVARNILSSSLQSMPHFPNVIILDSCNGLILYSTCYYPELYNIYNFSRKQRIVLPLIKANPSDTVGIAYDPCCISPHFKVVFISACYVRCPSRVVEVYSSKKGSVYQVCLNGSVSSMLDKFTFLQKKPVFIAGVLYFEVRGRKIVWFDCEREKLGIVELDRRMKGVNELLRIGECKGHLHYAELDLESGIWKICVWRLDAEKGVWKFVVEGKEFPPICIDKLLKIEALHPDCENTILLRLTKKIVSYNLIDGRGVEITNNANINAFGKEGEIFPVRPCFLQPFPKPSPSW